MEKKPLTMQQKYRIFNIGRIVSYTVLIFGFLMDGFKNPLTWIGLVAAIVLIQNKKAAPKKEAEDQTPKA